MGYPIDEIEAIAPVCRRRLAAVGITTTDHLLERCSTPQGRRVLADETGMSEQQILGWTHIADLARVTGIGCRFAELLESSGVDTVKELRNRDADNLADLLRAINDRRRLTDRAPSAPTVKRWIDRAREVTPKITY